MTASDENSGRNKAFRRLFDYISGSNESRTEVAMTAPVAIAAEPQEIAMTVPVETEARTADTNTMRFFLPAEFTMATAPRATDPDVTIVELPERTLAVLRFSGSRSVDTMARRQRDLGRVLANSHWRPDGEPLSLFYDPPWTLPFLRRNEAAVPVTGG